MKVLLLNPPFRRRIGNIWRYVSGVLPPLGLGYIAAVLEREGIDVDIVDAPAEGTSIELLPRRLGDAKYGLIGITATTTMFPSALAAARMLKEFYPSSMIVIGGVHATARPMDALNEPSVDAVVSGEGEFTFLDLAKGSDPRTTPGVLTRDGNGGFHTPGPRALIQDLDALPYPAYHKLPMSLYRPAIGGYHRLPAVHTLTSRGCAHQCTYCYHVFGRGVRFRDPGAVVDELKHMVDRFGVREVYFYDDTFNARRERVVELCEGMMKKTPGVEWQCLARVNGMDKELLALMKRSGCHSITYGVESASDDVLKNVKKRISLDEVERAVRLTRDADIICRVGFMLGNPGDTRQSMERTIQYAMDIRAHGVMFNIVAPYPGTEMFETGVKNGTITNFNWEEYDFSTPILKIPGIDADEIVKIQKMGHRRFFLRPAFFWTVLTHIKTLEGFKESVLGAMTVTGVLEVADRMQNWLKGIKA